MEEKLRILLLEDVSTDAELAERELRNAKISFSTTRVATKEAYLAELTSKPDIILADYSLPGFSGGEALALAREKCADIPFVFVSGAIGEERAIESLKQGATDYVLKQRLSRLVPAVKRALQETEERVERKRAQEALRQSEERHRVLLDINNAIIANLDKRSLFDAIAKALRQIIPFDQVRLTLLDPVKDLLRVHALAGVVPPKQFVPIGTEFRRQGSHLAPLFDERRPLIRRDLEEGATHWGGGPPATGGDAIVPCRAPHGQEAGLRGSDRLQPNTQSVLRSRRRVPHGGRAAGRSRRREHAGL